MKTAKDEKEINEVEGKTEDGKSQSTAILVCVPAERFGSKNGGTSTSATSSNAEYEKRGKSKNKNVTHNIDCK